MDNDKDAPYISSRYLDLTSARGYNSSTGASSTQSSRTGSPISSPYKTTPINSHSRLFSAASLSNRTTTPSKPSIHHSNKNSTDTTDNANITRSISLSSHSNNNDNFNTNGNLNRFSTTFYAASQKTLSASPVTPSNESRVSLSPRNSLSNQGSSLSPLNSSNGSPSNISTTSSENNNSASTNINTNGIHTVGNKNVEQILRQTSVGPQAHSYVPYNQHHSKSPLRNSRSSIDESVDYKKLYESEKRSINKIQVELDTIQKSIDENKVIIQSAKNTSLNLTPKQILELKLMEYEKEIQQHDKVVSDGEKLRAENRALSRVVARMHIQH